MKFLDPIHETGIVESIQFAGEDRGLGAAQVPAGCDLHLARQHGTGAAEHGERIGPATALGKRYHQQHVKGLVQRVVSEAGRER